jgi:hypothetical protein
MKLNIELAAEAKAKGICVEWYENLRRTEDKHALIKMFLAGIDFCISENFPSPRLFHFFDGIRQQYGIFRDEQVKAENSKYVVATGKCTGTATYTGYYVGQVFAQHETKLLVKATGDSFVMIDMFDNADIEIVVKDNAKVCVNKYGGNVVSETGNEAIKVIHKKSKTY